MNTSTGRPFEAAGAFAGATLGALRLQTLVRLRWLAVVGQTAAVLAVHFMFGFPLPIGISLGVIAVSAWLNIFLAIRWRKTPRISPSQTGLLLSFDIFQLAALLYLTGGLENPFAFLFLVPVTISATTLSSQWTMGLGAIAFACASFLALDHYPLPWNPVEPLSLPPVYIAGMWAAILCGVVFSAIYARRIAVEARQMSVALNATEMVLAREQKLSALDGLAAAAAHELGTPLATIALVAKELKRELPKDGPHADDIDLLIGQAARCREILTRLASHDSEADDVYQRTRLMVMIEDLVAPLRGPDTAIGIKAPGKDEAARGGSEPVFRRNPAITYGLGNLLENAADFARSRVEVDAHWTAHTVSVTVTDDGPGFHQAIFDRIGDPFVTTRPGYGEEPRQPGQHEGMGLGFFIAKTLLERSGATVTIANRQAPAQGAIVQVQWPREAVDLGNP